jgi:hypothetical protein
LAHLIFNIAFWLHLVSKKEKAARNFVEEREHDFFFFGVYFLKIFSWNFSFGFGSVRAGRRSRAFFRETIFRNLVLVSLVIYTLEAGVYALGNRCFDAWRRSCCCFLFFFLAEVGLRRFLLECLSTRGFCLFFFPQSRSKFDIHSDGY